MAIKGVFYVRALVSDMARSKKFYAESLGWDVRLDQQDVVSLAFGSGYLILVSQPGMDSNAAARKAGDMYVEVEVEDVNAEHARLKKFGIEVSELQDQHWGERNFSFTDPDGYLWFYGQTTVRHE